ncbi:MarR family winged helix-turn-helix transcriptional regulator [Phreatobacter stygius]|uniref:MarR family transcriptional regulator n=1 Tax=Phreatobacter stygius TaxID=1940610 RepID=A0A4D7ATL5_9HYPH|nr:MarR family transcriptional regulator [Phreatobacter stygius]QCI62925.1 MarR family transcriptional regulator [Phreatobacter stygius]
MTTVPTTATDLAFRVFNEIGIISQLSTTAFERAMPDGMTLAQFTVLNHFVRLGGRRRPSDLARAFQLTKATMSSTLQRLEAKALVVIAADASDGRGRLVEITGAGRAMHADCIQRLGPMLVALVAAIGEAPFAAAIDPLVRLRQELDGMRD